MRSETVYISALSIAHIALLALAEEPVMVSWSDVLALQLRKDRISQVRSAHSAIHEYEDILGSCKNHL